MTADPFPWDEITEDETSTVDLGSRLAALLEPGQVVRLRGDLGAGKTCFTRGLARGLGADPSSVHSPSFSLVHRYPDAAGRPVLYHVDLYRIEGEVDLREIGLEDVLDSPVPCAVEWAERLGAGRFAATAGDLEVELSVLGPQRRRVRVRRL